MYSFGIYIYILFVRLAAFFGHKKAKKMLAGHREIFSVMQRMYLKSKNIDVVTLINELAVNGVYDEAGGREYLRLLAETVPTASNAKDYAKII